MLLKITTLLGIITILGSCSLPGTQVEKTKTDGTIEFSGSGFNLQIPSNWNTESLNNIPTPRKGTIAMIAVSPEINYGFSNNIVILEDTLDSIMTSRKYSELNQIQTTQNYLEYKKIKDEAILFVDDDESHITIFEARYNSNTTKLKFIQTAKVCGTKVYLLHAAIALDKDANNYINLFKTFKCN